MDFMADNGGFNGGGRRKDAVEPTDLDKAFEDFGVPDPPSGAGSASDASSVAGSIPLPNAAASAATSAIPLPDSSSAPTQNWASAGGQIPFPRTAVNPSGATDQAQTEVFQPIQAVQTAAQGGFAGQENFAGQAGYMAQSIGGNGNAGNAGNIGNAGHGRHNGRSTGNNGSNGGNGRNGNAKTPRSKSRRLWTVLGIFAEILFTVAAICALYIVWQMWWTGVQSEHTQYNQRQSVSWSDPSKSAGSSKGVSIAKAQNGTPPVQPKSADTGDIVAQIYIPRFGDQWQRNIVQGTDMTSLNKHGMGHYTDSQMPGQIGNFAAAGHRNGYGQPLGDVDKLKTGDPIVLRTKDYWYVYTYTSYKIVTPDHVEVVAPNPDDPTAPATQRMITLTTCEPKYSTPTHRWITYGKFKYWAKVSDGVPQELTHLGQNGKVQFINNQRESVFAKLPSLVPIITALLVIYVVLFIAAALAWRWPLRRAIRNGEVKKPDPSIYGGLMRLQPGIKGIRILLVLLLLVAVALAIMQWACPWAASNIPILHQMSNYVAVNN